MSDSQNGKAPASATQLEPARTHLNGRIILHACELLGTLDAARGRPPLAHAMDIKREVGELLDHITDGSRAYYPERGHGSLLGDWCRWYCDAYELEVTRAEVVR